MTTPKTCSKYGCKEPHYRMWLCEKHYTENKEREQKENEAISLLHTGVIENELVENSMLAIELEKALNVWRKCNISYQFNESENRTTDMLVQQCISYACAIIEAEKSSRKGKEPSHFFEIAKERFYSNINAMLKDI